MVTHNSYQRAVAQVRSRVLSVASSLWAGLGSYRDSDIDRLVSLVVPMVQAGQVQVANLTEAYFSQIGAQAGVDFGHVTGGRGVPAVDVYRRPATTTYTALSQGESFSTAIAMGGERLASLVAMDMQMSKVRQADKALQSAGVTSYMRVLTGSENCALCVIASTQRYRTGALLPIHPGCDCTVDVLPSGYNPERQVIDPDLLDSTYVEIATRLDHVSVGRDARDLGLGKTDIEGRPISDFTDLIVTRTHGEYGPTLSWRDHKFTSEADIAALH